MRCGRVLWLQRHRTGPRISMLVKICGLQSAEAAAEALDHGADCLGVICVPNRKRTITKDVAVQISKLVHARAASGSAGSAGSAQLVGVFRNQPVEQVMQLYREYQLDVVQLHGSEDIFAYRSEIPEEVPIIKRLLFPDDCGVLADVARLPNVRVLFDSDAGGTGEQLDWSTIAGWADAHPDSRFIIAGGLTPANVAAAIRTLAPYAVGVDTSGGVETDGAKDAAKIRSFIDAARAAAL